MDVHAPHQPIHTKKDFFLHLFTITVGLLIAVGIEGCVELHREHTLVKEARATLREEIEHNTDSMKGALTKLEAEDTAIRNNIKTLTAALRDPTGKETKDANISAAFSIIGLRETAWKTAQATNALTYMPYTEAQRYSDVYDMQREFLDQQAKILEDEAQFLGLVRQTDFGHSDLTQDQAKAALNRFGIWQAHLSYLILMAKATAANDQAFLDGKEGPHEMHEELSGDK